MFTVVLAPLLPNHPLSIKCISKTGGLLETKTDDILMDEYGNVKTTINVKLVIPLGYTIVKLMYVFWAVHLTTGQWTNVVYGDDKGSVTSDHGFRIAQGTIWHMFVEQELLMTTLNVSLHVHNYALNFDTALVQVGALTGDGHV